MDESERAATLQAVASFIFEISSSSSHLSSRAHLSGRRQRAQSRKCAELAWQAVGLRRQLLEAH
eukprot:9934321-Alexandrium_andersonii.AAC.1